MISVIVAAAGTGSRMNHEKKKQFIELSGVPIIVRTLRAFELDEIDEVIVVTGKEDISLIEAMVKDFGIKKVKAVIAGGPRRQDSIYNGLKKVSGDTVLIHDGARPFVSKKMILDHIEKDHKDCGFISAVPSKDTIKLVRDGMVEETLDRSLLYNVQTPQSFETKSLLKAYDYAYKKALSVTDDASVYEAYGKTVKIVNGRYENIKITTPEDLAIGEYMIKTNSK
ncbi:2-C-methyl-D-erythritol 4-phosphate cytidylyltransferase [Acidaminobacter sp. JC074]|uniref:2-C-methyl-D-erythritol 4-phosphate cytidylyltransferase n=1 Tax=Acidaminobacter sp. JC074 TaxID=2530199 RepID=UPI001F0F672D|nr:2-C-methyl-D-erythritol 4-phosphate cytidylyltransferase [Acidaminobacter sp. JC074]MCH4890454.1 2-C-methyl-D-erythritol 4-phosphate cytidylyltransferase [Acidaminobacter sp. JC074]